MGVSGKHPCAYKTLLFLMILCCASVFLLKTIVLKPRGYADPETHPHRQSLVDITKTSTAIHVNKSREARVTSDRLQSSGQQQNDLKPVNNKPVYIYTNEIKAFSIICIEKPNKTATKIVVYDAPKNETLSFLGIAGYRKKWTITLKQTHIPETHTRLDVHAYFVDYTYIGNLYHLWRDTLPGTYASMKRMGDYRNGTENQKQEIYFLSNDYNYGTRGKTPLRTVETERALSNSLLEILGIKYNKVYTDVPADTCFKLGVFGQSFPKQGELERVLRQNLGIDPTTCKLQVHKRHIQAVVILRRNFRNITNAGDVKIILEQEFNASVVMPYFEDMTIREQIALVSCSDVMIGVHGAGLANYRFLRKGGVFVELGYPGLPGGAFCIGKRGFKCVLQKNNKSNLTEKSWESYFKYYPLMRNIPRETLKSEALKKYGRVGRYTQRENLFKIADCVVDIPTLRSNIRKLLAL